MKIIFNLSMISIEIDFIMLNGHGLGSHGFTWWAWLSYGNARVKDEKLTLLQWLLKCMRITPLEVVWSLRNWKKKIILRVTRGCLDCNTNCWCEFKPTTRSAPLGYDAAMKKLILSEFESERQRDKEFFKLFGPHPE